MLVWDEIVGARVVSFSYLVVIFCCELYFFDFSLLNFRPKDAIKAK